MKKVLGAGFVAAGAAAMAVTWFWLGNRRVARWEILDQDDAEDGEFITLSDGARMHYRMRAPAPRQASAPDDVILIHGLMDSAYHWVKNMDALAETHRVWAIDLVGFGFSSRPTAPTYSLKTFARHVREFMDARGIARARIVGHSLGGAVALEFAHDFPERVTQLFLIAPATFLLLLRPEVKLAAHLPFVPRALIGWMMTNRRARMSVWRNAVGDPAHIDLAEASLRSRAVRVKGTTDALVAMLASPHLSDLPHGLEKIDVPTLIVWGDRDHAVPLRHGGYHARSLPNSKLIVIEGAGHIPQNEYPAQMNRLMLEFFQTGINAPAFSSRGA